MTAKDWLYQFTEASNERRLYHTDESLMKLRQLQKAIYEETMEIVNSGSYKADDGTWVTLPDWNTMYENTVLYSQPIELDQSKLKMYETQVEVESIDCIIAGRNLQLQGYNPVVLNMASAQNPGGGVINGAGAQEENLFRRSNLFKSMYQFARYAEDYGLEKSESQYPLDKNYGGVYTPNAVVFRGPESAGYPLLKQPYILSFVAVAGLSNPETINNRLVPDSVTITKNKIRTIFRIALLHGHDSIVLGALGCGAFRNPPSHIAGIFHQVMNEPEFRNHFKMLFFAILEDHNSKRRHNPEGNRVPFMREFGLMPDNDTSEIKIPKNMELKKIKVTAVNLDIRKSITITIDMKDMVKCKTQDAVKKAIENKMLETKVFKKTELIKLKYQGRKDVLDEWKVIRPIIVQQESPEEIAKKVSGRITPNNITTLSDNEVFVFGSNARGQHGGGAARYALDHFGAVMGVGHGMQGKSYAINSMSGLPLMGEDVKTFVEYARQHPEKTFFVTAIGCGIAGYKPSDIAPYFECCKELSNVTLPLEFWIVIGAPQN